MNCDGCPYILRKKLIIGYFRYVDILIINKNTNTILTTYWKISITYIC